MNLMADIMEKIIEVINDFRVHRNRYPTRIYLGKNEFAAMKQLQFQIPSSGAEIRDMADGVERSKINGLPVFIVDSDSHLFCG